MAKRGMVNATHIGSLVEDHLAVGIGSLTGGHHPEKFDCGHRVRTPLTVQVRGAGVDVKLEKPHRWSPVDSQNRCHILAMSVMSMSHMTPI